jgi:hypothetical protein
VAETISIGSRPGIRKGRETMNVRDPMKRAVMFWLVASLALPGCALTIKPVDFSWSYESVMTADANGNYRAEPKTIAFNGAEVFKAESGKKDAVADRPVRVIRDAAGYYYVTAAGFKSVYVFKGAEGKLTLKKKVLIDPNGMEKPFFNRREEGIELAAGGQSYLLNKKGIVPRGKK